MTEGRFMKRLLVATFILISTISSSFAADTWKHLLLQSEDGVKITVDYQVHYRQSSSSRPQNEIVVCPMHFNVWYDDPAHNDRVVLFFQNKQRQVGADYTSAEQYNYYPQFYGDHFSVEFQQGDRHYQDGARSRINTPCMYIYSDGFSGRWFYSQELSVQINGHWLTDPISGTHNFRFNLYEHHFLP